MTEVLHLSNTDSGGAGSAAYNLHRQMLELGIRSKLLVSSKTRNDETIVSAVRKSRFSRKLRKWQQRVVDLFLDDTFMFYGFLDKPNATLQQWLMSHITNETKVIMMHWASHFVSLQDLSKITEGLKLKVVIVLMDMAPFTGGCHYSFGCSNYCNQCFSCPATTSSFVTKRIRQNFHEKAMTTKIMQIPAICVNYFIGEQAKRSAMPFSDYLYIKPPVDQAIFKYSNKYQRALNDCPVILIGAYNTNDQRKGYLTLALALNHLSTQLIAEGKRVRIMIPYGTRCPELAAQCYDFVEFPYATTPSLLADLYHQANLFVNTSVDDSGPMMVTEAVLCGVPVVATAVGIILELLKYDHNFGRSVDIFSFKALAEEMYGVLYGEADKRLVPSEERAQSAQKYFERFLSIKELMQKLTD